MKYSIPYGTGAQTLETNDPALVLESKIQSLEACADEAQGSPGRHGCAHRQSDPAPVGPG